MQATGRFFFLPSPGIRQRWESLQRHSPTAAAEDHSKATNRTGTGGRRRVREKKEGGEGGREVFLPGRDFYFALRRREIPLC